MRKPNSKMIVGFGLLAFSAVAILFSPRIQEIWPSVREEIVALQSFVDANLLLVAAFYFLAYVAVTGLSLPSATAMTLIGGALFGRWLGTALAICACTIGATLAFWSACYFFRDFVLRRFGHRLGWLSRGMERDGIYFLLSLRLLAVVPYFVLNLLIALTPVRTRTYFWTTFLGMLPVTFLLANAGTALAQVDDPARALPWEIVGSLALLALLPQLIRKAVRWNRPNREVPNAFHA